MTRSVWRSTALIFVLALTMVSCTSDGGPTSNLSMTPAPSQDSDVAPAAAGKRFALQFVSEAFAELRPIPPTASGSDSGLCFDGTLIDVATGHVIGTASDCLADISGSPEDGMSLVGTTIFNLPGGTLVSRGLTTVQPILTPSAGTPITHITGAIPNPGDNSIIGGTGRYAGATGAVRLNGAVNLSNLENGQITFDCLFVIELD
jgi:hypothetical protein